jgi:type I restriction enzyme, S subunit
MIPDGWQLLSLDSITEIDKPIVYGIVQAGIHIPDGVPYIKSSDVGKDINKNSLQRTSELIAQKYKRSEVKPGDVVFSLRGNIGESSIVPTNLTRANLTQGTARISVCNNHSNKFVKYALSSNYVAKKIGMAAKGSTFQEISLQELRKLEILLPPLLEQCRIAEVLGVWDESIDLLERLIGRVRSRKQGLMQQLLTGKKRFKEFEGSEWKKLSIGEIAFVDKRSLNNSTPKDYTFFYISLSDIDNGHISNNLEQLCFEKAPSRARRLVSNNDIIMATVRPNLKSFAIVKTDADKYVVSTGFAVITAKKGCCPDYLYQYIFSNHIEKQIEALVTGSNYPAINSTEIKNLSVCCPSLPEQEKIAAVLSAADEEISTLEKQLAAYKQQKLGLMQQLLTRRIRI